MMKKLASVWIHPHKQIYLQCNHHLLILSLWVHQHLLLQENVAEQGVDIRHSTQIIYLLNHDNFFRNHNRNNYVLLPLPISLHSAHHQSNQNHVLLPLPISLHSAHHQSNQNHVLLPLPISLHSAHHQSNQNHVLPTGKFIFILSKSTTAYYCRTLLIMLLEIIHHAQ